MSRLTPLALAAALALAGCQSAPSHSALSAPPSVAEFCSTRGSTQANAQCQQWYAANPRLRPPGAMVYEPEPPVAYARVPMASYGGGGYSGFVAPPEPWSAFELGMDVGGPFQFGDTVLGAPEFGQTLSSPDFTCSSFHLVGRRDLGSTIDCH